MIHLPAPESGGLLSGILPSRGTKPAVAIVALGGYAPCDASLDKGVARLRQAGFDVRSLYDPARKHQRFGGTDDGRLAQLDAALGDPDVEIILALRGGYGLSRLLARIDFRRIAESGKLLVGHSDFTALQMGLLAESGAASFAGPMLCDDFTAETIDPFMWDAFLACLRGPQCALEFASVGGPSVEVDGMLWGGNLAMLCHLAGTRFLPRIEGGILFVEDVNEHPYRIERMILQLFHSGVIGDQKALVLGDFSRYRLSDYDNGYDFAAMLDYLRKTLPVPVIDGLPFGHVPAKATLAVGSTATLRSNGTTAVLSMRDYPCLSGAPGV